ncbi:MAG: electron transfer flavoprotein subunit beta/FixA family protein [Bdellovibrionales bacterium]|nr:electron transfer flavoprotein subunit beta/FixA family protein [Bdellovibrionales bacterium]
MRIYVCVKQVPDTETKLKLKEDSTGIDVAGIKWIMNPYDEIAVEEALRIKEAKGGAANVTVVSVGPKSRITDCIRSALAMGADDGIAIDTAYEIDPFATAHLIHAALKKETSVDLILTGKLAIDDNCSSTGQALAEYLGIPHTSVVSKLTLQESGALAEREVEGGSREIVELRLPCLIAVNKGLNTPRYASLPGIMKAKKKPIKECTGSELGGDTFLKIKYSHFQLPAEKPPVKLIQGDSAQQAKELCRLLKEEAKVF